MGLGFNANVVVVKKPYSPALVKTIMNVASSVLAHYGMVIEKEVRRIEYERNMESKEVNQYIRVEQKNLKEQKDNAFRLVKIGSKRYDTIEHFKSVRYAFCSISSFGEYTVIWFNYHSRLYAFNEFKSFTLLLCDGLSRVMRCESMVMQATSLSRNADMFVLYYNGKPRNNLSGKGALTKVKQMYGLDINHIMENVDKNLAIYYAPRDYANVKRQMKEQKERFKKFCQQAEDVTVTDKVTGENMMKTFVRENNIIMKSLNDQYERITEYMSADPIGDVVFFYIGNTKSENALAEHEIKFGANTLELDGKPGKDLYGK